MMIPKAILTNLLLTGAVCFSPPLPAGAAGPAEEPAAEEASATAAEEASAATAAASFGEEILVTARRREENVQRIPISVAAFSESELDERSILDVRSLDQFVPNFEYQSSFRADQPSEATIFIRGLGQTDSTMYLDPGVGLYVDGVYVRAQGAVVDLVDLERIEVLRGPQGTLYGRNTIGGAVNLITRKPEGERSGRLTATVGDYDRRDLRGSFGGGLGERGRGSLTLLRTRRDGYVRSRPTGARFNDDDRAAGRLALGFDPSPAVMVDLSADYTRERETGGPLALFSVDDSVPLIEFYNDARALYGLPGYTAQWLTGDFRETNASAPSDFDGDFYGTTLNLSWIRRDVRLQSISAWRAFEYASTGDLDGSPLPVATRWLEQDQDQISQELHLSGSKGRLRWLVGALYLREKPVEKSTNLVFGDLFGLLEAAPGPVLAPPGAPDFFCNPGPPPPGVVCFGGAGNPLNFAFFAGDGQHFGFTMKTESLALFSQETFDLGARLSLTLGLRYTRDEKKMDLYNYPANGVGNVELSGEDAWDAWTPRLSLAWQLRPEVLLYANAARGFKSGGLNGRPQSGGEIVAFDPEKLWTYELGFKSQWRHRMRLNAATFYSDYEDLQFLVLVIAPGPIYGLTRNAGQARIRGFEVELEAQPVAGLVVNAGVGHLDGELRQVAPGVSPEAVGNRLPKAPEWSYNLGLQYAFALGQSGALIARSDYSYRSHTFNDVENSPGIAQDAYGLLQARLGYAPPSGRWDLALYGTNLTDEQYVEQGIFIATVGTGTGTVGPPREWGLSFQLRF